MSKLNFYKLIPYPIDRQGLPMRPRYPLTRGLNRTRHEKDAMTSHCLDRKGSTMRHLANAHSVTGPAGSTGLLFLTGPTGKAIVHWIGY